MPSHANQFFNAGGAFKLQSSWTWPLRLTARWSMVFARVEPPEAVALSHLAEDCFSVVSGSSVDVTGFVRLFLAHTIKWPPAVHHFAQISCEAADAASLLDAYIATLRFASGRTWPTMFHRMDVGRVICSTGLVFHARNLQLIAPALPSEGGGKRLIAKTRTQQHQLLHLGRHGTPHHLLASPQGALLASPQGAQHVFAECIHLVETWKLTWPSKAGVQDFLSQVRALVCRIRSARCPRSAATFGCGDTARSSYCVHSFVRVMLGVLGKTMPEALQDVQMSDLLKFCPDVRHHAAPLRDMTYQEASTMFGHMPPPMIPYWACLASSIPQHRLEAALKLDVMKVWDILDQYMIQLHSDQHDKDDFLYPPTPKVIVDILLGEEQ